MNSNREDYLQAIYRLTKKKGHATNKGISDYLKVSKPSVTEMLRKLDKDGLLIINKTKIILSDKGTEQAQALLSRHRLWEYFLKEKLGFSDEKFVHNQADLLEHATTNELLEALNKFLEYPDLSPNGNVIYTNVNEGDKEIK